MANGFALRKGDRLIANNFVCSKDLKLALDNIELNEEDGNQLIDHVAHCRNLETLVFPNLVRSQRSTFARRIQYLPLRSIAFRSNTTVFGEVCSLLGQTPLRTLSISSQILSSSDTTQLGRWLSRGTIKKMNMIECTFEDMEALIRGLNTSKVSELSISAPEFPNSTIGCSEVIKSLRGLDVIKVTRVHFQDATATLHGIIQQTRLKQILVKIDPEYLEDSDRYSITSLMASAVRANKKVGSVGLSIFDSDNLELITTSLARSRRIKKLALYIEDCTDRVLKLIAPLIAAKKSKLRKLKLKFSTNLTYDQSTYISSIFNGTHSIRNIYLANLYADPILARFCSRRSEIQKLRLKYCKFIPSTMEYIGTIMMNSDATLQVLDLTGSIINAEQLEKLTEHVKITNRRSLKQIRVYLDEIDLASPTEAASVNNFIRSLDQHRTLQKIDIYGAYMDEETSKLILELVTKNKIAKFNFDMIEEAENTKMIELEDKINQILQTNRCNIRRRERLEKQISLARKIIYQSDRGDLKVLPEEIVCHILDLFDEDNLFM